MDSIFRETKKRKCGRKKEKGEVKREKANEEKKKESKDSNAVYKRNGDQRR